MSGPGRLRQLLVRQLPCDELAEAVAHPLLDLVDRVGFEPELAADAVDAVALEQPLEHRDALRIARPSHLVQREPIVVLHPFAFPRGLELSLSGRLLRLVGCRAVRPSWCS